ncbi:DNA cytosine methyltransferase [Streptomyces sp. NPDC004647]|uniref:DNA cytosine methyltransferase n=1 Tax=Streptomyces sp. NPDC004647 TaxID=3154671 RepID=UPI0033B36E40
MNAARPTEPIRVVDLFAGCGGFTQGFHSYHPEGRYDAAVFHSVAAVEHDPAAASTYAANFAESMGGREHIYDGDIEDWFPGDDEIGAEVILGGPPCQGFSGLGRRDPKDPRNKLWRQYIRIVKTIEPKVFVIENVDRFLRSPEFTDLRSEVQKDGELGNYRIIAPPGSRAGDSEQERIRRYLLNAADYNAPQARRRAIVIGVHEDLIDPNADPLTLGEMWYPTRTNTKLHRSTAVRGETTMLPLEDESSESGKPPWRTVEEIFQRSAQLPIQGTELPERAGRRLDSGEVLPPEYTTTELHIGRSPEDLSRARYMAIPKGGNRKDLREKWYKIDRHGGIHLSTDPDYGRHKAPAHYLSTPSWDGHNKGSGDVMGRMHIDRPSVTIRTEFFKPEKGRYLHPTENRPITHFEAARIQGFPEDFKWCGSKIDIARQIGNAVPIDLGIALARVIHARLRH